MSACSATIELFGWRVSLVFSQSCPDFASGLTMYTISWLFTAMGHNMYIYNTTAFLSSHGVSGPTLTRREWIMVVVPDACLLYVVSFQGQCSRSGWWSDQFFFNSHFFLLHVKFKHEASYKAIYQGWHALST